MDATNATDLNGALGRRPDPLPPGFRRQVATVNGAPLSYLIGGTGHPLILLHGWPQTALAWRDVLAPLARLGHTVIAPDLRGIGQSHSPRDRAESRPGSGYDKDSQADGIRDLVAALGLGRRVRLVGHDVGGMIAFAYARRYPDGVDRLVLAELAVPGFGLEEAMDVARGGRWHFGFFMTPDVPEMLLSGHEEEFFTWWFHHLAADPSTFGPDQIAAVAITYTGRDALRAGFEHYRTLLADGQANRDWYAAGGRLTVPTLALGGEHAVGTRLADALRDVASDLTTGVVPGSGHFLAEENPEAFLALLTPFVPASPQATRPAHESSGESGYGPDAHTKGT